MAHMHLAVVHWTGPANEPYVHPVRTLTSEESAIRLGENWIEDHPQRGSLVDATVKYIGKEPV